ncbi:MAG: carbon-phosphorus lyase complex subunit PhnI [Dehalococcoidia bacterium]|jgi:alpha-D-ribose 1-methylphosphonate 5-triphosphate synthase subunit PhnI|uniref:carbon-phosphorus lyase complex subunit PhnI n=1 Tax=Candidatus Amarobacter glycogenicus TaxID=3140699 RepID=UPI0031363FD4|nr:carbon-phosphorus lyase complex subunit PhnI [Dehalococcoidia bacterium]MBK6561332.1 carbon-phosphorus lyase complex subunit PhnI [Dehalococcoidia bacterium]MBK8561105.1 carbon-phosphorus lyase complex subunit PhnI [Dehalococcoidia bacterium]MBK9342984.1 carbon-phosphorus lyase complex subunit PhnI [Dehalococcoidia bacterium]
MGYTAMQGGLSAIKAAEDLVRRRTLGRRRHALDPSEVAEKMSLGVDRVMSEGGLYDPAAAAVALVQAEGDLHEASFIVRAYRSTLPRIAYSIPTDTGEMRVLRRITPAFQFAPGGQLLGATRDYTQRLLDWRIAEPGSFAEDQAEPDACRAEPPVFTRIADLLRAEGLLPAPNESSPEPDDITRSPIVFPASRSARLQTLARAETGSITAFGYSSMRGYGTFAHGTVAELRVGLIPFRIRHPYTGQPVKVGEVQVTEAEEFTISPHRHPNAEDVEQFALGYGLVFGQNERKAIAMAMLDRQLAEGGGAMASQEEFVLMHIDGIEATGFVEHLKLPHYVEFQSILQGMRRRRDRHAATTTEREAALV